MFQSDLYQQSMKVFLDEYTLLISKFQKTVWQPQMAQINIRENIIAEQC